MSESMIDRMYGENRRLQEYLTEAQEISHLANVDSQFRKVLVMSAASLFEVTIRQFILDYFTEKTQGDSACLSFVKAKAIERQYHTYFKWEAGNANQFFGLFGSGFKEFMSRKVSADNALQTGVRAFLELGDLRNNMAHKDFGNFPLDKTVEEIYLLYRQASVFVDALSGSLKEYSEAEARAPNSE